MGIGWRRPLLGQEGKEKVHPSLVKEGWRETPGWFCQLAMMKLLLAFALATTGFFSMVAAGQAPVKCVVLDPELQASYSGGCKDGLAEGDGEASGAAQYKGGFKAGRKHGKGVKVWRTGDRYEGGFVEDRREGSGTYTWGRFSPWAGEKYSGEWRNDRRHGFGVYEWPGGDLYAGPWDDDIVIGKATPRMVARTWTYAEHVAAVGKPGVKVCREMLVGIATRDRVRGTVTAVENDRILVRVDDAGRFQHSLGNTVITKGITVRDALTSWFPCN